MKLDTMTRLKIIASGIKKSYVLVSKHQLVINRTCRTFVHTFSTLGALNYRFSLRKRFFGDREQLTTFHAQATFFAEVYVDFYLKRIDDPN